MPSAASVSGTKSVRVIDAYASGKQVHSSTQTKISHTWLASQTGAMAWSMTSRGRSPRLRPARHEVPEAGAEVGAAEDRVVVIAANRMRAAVVAIRAAPSASSADARVARPDRLARPVRHVGLAGAVALPEAAAHLAQHQDRGDAEPDVEEDHADEGDPDPGVGGGGVLDLHLLVDDPGLAADLADDPARLHGDHGEHPGGGGGPEEPLALGHVSPEDPGRPPPQGEQEQQGAEADHQVPGQVDDVDLVDGRAGPSAGVSSSPWMTVDVPVLGSDRIEASPGIGTPPTTSPSELR